MASQVCVRFLLLSVSHHLPIMRKYLRSSENSLTISIIPAIPGSLQLE